MQDKIDSDLKTALLAGDKLKTETLRGLKGAIHNETIAQGAQESGLKDEDIQKVLAREAKKRAEAAELYKQGGNSQRAETELSEKAIIDNYLPEQLDETEIAMAVDEEIANIESPQLSDTGRIIGAVRARLGAGADGATIAKLVKAKLEQ